MRAFFATTLELAGACAIGYGLWLMFPPASFIFGGAAAMWGGYQIEVGA